MGMYTVVYIGDDGSLQVLTQSLSIAQAIVAQRIQDPRRQQIVIRDMGRLGEGGKLEVMARDSKSCHILIVRLADHDMQAS